MSGAPESKMGAAKKPLRIKIISVGNAEVGKSCLIKRFCEKRFVHKYLTTIGIDYGVTKARISNRDVKVNIFDLAGNPLFYEVRNEFYADTQGALLVYDASDRGSFDALERWLEEMRAHVGNPRDMENVVFVVCANKVDARPRAVDTLDGRLWADARGFAYFETSASTGDGVTDAFNRLFEGVVAAVENGGTPPPRPAPQLAYSREQIDAIQKLKNAKSDWERLGLTPTASKDDVNKAYRKLAVLLHPDKSVAPGSEDAFKILVATRTALLKNAR